MEVKNASIYNPFVLEHVQNNNHLTLTNKLAEIKY